jgi:hypothetical protein
MEYLNLYISILCDSSNPICECPKVFSIFSPPAGFLLPLFPIYVRIFIYKYFISTNFWKFRPSHKTGKEKP